MIGEVNALLGQEALVPSADRRVSRRVVDAWARTARGHFPSWADLQRFDLGEDWEWVFVVDLRQSIGFPYFVYLGDKLAKLSDVYLSGSEDWTLSLLDKATATIGGAVAEAGPHHYEDELRLCDGRPVMFRCTSAPLADDGETVTHVFGAVNGRLKYEEAHLPAKLV